MSPAAPEPAPPGPVWSDDNLADPHAVADKARRVEAMFAAIAPSYDLNNRLHSLGRDQAWRRAAVRLADPQPTDTVVDVACGTGDLSLAFAKAGARRVLGVDFTVPMLHHAHAKTRSQSRAQPPAAAPRPGAPAAPRVTYHAGDALRLPLADASADVVSIAFGIRNVADPAAAIAEFFRVLRPGGRLIVLEFSLPKNPALLAAYNFYFRRVMPRTAALIARDTTGAYRYLPQSVNTFIDRDGMARLYHDAGFTRFTLKPLTFGIAVAYRGDKPPA